MTADGFFRSPRGRIAKGAITASFTFVTLGSVSALWDNPLFVRMTPAGDLEIALLLILSLLLGLYVGIKRPRCSVRTAGAGTVLGFLGVACPVCNKLLLLLLGADVLLTYFEPVRIYVALFGVLLTGFAVIREWRLRGESCGPGLDEGETTPAT